MSPCPGTVFFHSSPIKYPDIPFEGVKVQMFIFYTGTGTEVMGFLLTLTLTLLADRHF